MDTEDFKRYKAELSGLLGIDPKLDVFEEIKRLKRIESLFLKIKDACNSNTVV